MKAPSLPITCPKCGESATVTSKGKRHSLYPSIYAMMLPLFLAQLHQLHAPTDYHCPACGRSFKRRTHFAKVATIALLGIGLLLYILYVLLWNQMIRLDQP